MLEIPKKIITSIVQSSHVKLNGQNFKVNKHYYWPWMSWGLWERNLQRFFSNYVQPDKESIDIGAYFGGTSMLAYSFGASKVHSIEADPLNFEILKDNIIRNNLTNIIIPYNLAVFKESGSTVRFGFRDETHKTESTKTFNDSGLPVKTITFADFLKDRNLRNTGTIKIDIEGAERYVGSGLELIANSDTDAHIFLSMHTPFFDDKKKVAAELLPYLELFKIRTAADKPLSKDKLLKEMLSEQKCGWQNRTGKFFDLILHQR